MNSQNTSFADFTWASSMVMSRAFLFKIADGSEVFVVAPLLELSNHDPEAAAQWFYDDSVRIHKACSLCTSPAERSTSTSV